MCVYGLQGYLDTGTGMSMEDVRKFEVEMQRETNSRVVEGMDLQAETKKPAAATASCT